MTHSIIVPIDLSFVDHIHAMVEIAKQVAKPDEEIILLTVIEEIPGFAAMHLPEGTLGKNVSRAKTKLQELITEQGIDATPMVIPGHAADGILNAADKNDARVIVIGSHRPGWETYLIGSTAARVMRHAKCSVYVVR